jgi:DNA-directed RNA polymerase specialized sigma24 family protein
VAQPSAIRAGEDYVAVSGDDHNPGSQSKPFRHIARGVAAEEPVVAEVVKLRYFAGLTAEQAALALNISLRTTNRHRAFARAWLYRRLNPLGDTSA